MTLRVTSTVQTGLGTISKSVTADTAADWQKIQTVFQRALNLWPDAPPEIKELADIVIEGKPLQDYYSQANIPRSEDVKTF